MSSFTWYSWLKNVLLLKFGHFSHSYHGLISMKWPILSRKSFLCWAYHVKELIVSYGNMFKLLKLDLPNWSYGYHNVMYCVFMIVYWPLHSPCSSFSGLNSWLTTMLCTSIFSLVSSWTSLSVSYRERNSAIHTQMNVALSCECVNVCVGGCACCWWSRLSKWP